MDLHDKQFHSVPLMARGQPWLYTILSQLPGGSSENINMGFYEGEGFYEREREK